ncbi:MAG: flagellar basal body rod protein FlgB [Spirochaetales bacterium]|jgi:flagellar basal-body rod protein FlgB|nr:flagellar basal body rod protein FlgB [Spirochaetales bacterium]
MFERTEFGKHLEVMNRVLNAGSLRADIISNNLSNADDPNFKRTTLSFESQLRRALESEKLPSTPAALTNPRHIPFDRPMDWREVKPIRNLEHLSTMDNNGNNVDVEVETMEFLRTQMTNNLLTAAIASHFDRISLVLR